MSDQGGLTTGKLVRGAAAGLVAGITASFVMDRFQAALGALSSSATDQDEPATEKAADGIARALTGTAVAGGNKALAGQAIHYVLGAALGVVYGVTAELRPSVTTGFGTAFGLGTATLLDEIAVPLSGVGKPPWQAGLSGNLYSYASHLVFGGATELVRRHVRATLDK